MTLKCEKNSLTGPSADRRGLSFAGGIWCGHNCHDSMFKIASARPWTFSSHVDNMAHHYHRSGRSLEYNFCILGIAATGPHAWASDLADNEFNKLLREPSSRNPENPIDHPGRRGGNGGQTWEYAVDRIVQHVGNGCQVKYVVQWYG